MQGRRASYLFPHDPLYLANRYSEAMKVSTYDTISKCIEQLVSIEYGFDTMNNKSKYLVLLEQLKKIIRTKKWNYAKLAKTVNLSEPTIKRIFQGVPCNISHLLAICDAVEISFLDLLQLATEAEPQKTFLTGDQERFFVKNFDCYAFLFALYYKTDGTLKEIQRKWGLSDKESFTYLRQLEKLGLLELLPENEIQWKIKGQLNVSENGPILKSGYFEEEAHEMLSNIYKRWDDQQNVIHFAGFQLSTSNFKKFKQELRELNEKYYTIGARDEYMVPPTEKKFYGLVFALGPYSFDLHKYFEKGKKGLPSKGKKG